MTQQKKGTSRKIRIGQTVYDVSDLPAFAVWTARQDQFGSALRQIQIRQDDIPNEVFAALLALLRSPDPDSLVRHMDIVLVYELMRVMDYFGMYGNDTRQVRHALYGRHRHHVQGSKTRIHEVYDAVPQDFQRQIQKEQEQKKERKESLHRQIGKITHPVLMNRLVLRRQLRQTPRDAGLRRRVLLDAVRFVPPDPLDPLAVRREPQVHRFYFLDNVLARMLRDRDRARIWPRMIYNHRVAVAYGVVDRNGEYRIMENIYILPPGEAFNPDMLDEGRLVLDEVHDITQDLPRVYSVRRSG
ncbi:hypothetical protein EBZ80_19275 [bacterium]|nr:hypothetical protein [bacterium]